MHIECRYETICVSRVLEDEEGAVRTYYIRIRTILPLAVR